MDIRKIFPWKGLSRTEHKPREVVESPFKKSVDVALGDMVYWWDLAVLGWIDALRSGCNSADKVCYARDTIY